MKTYDLNNLSLRDSLEITRDMWNWLADNPSKEKEAALRALGITQDITASCACCVYNKQKLGNSNFDVSRCCVGDKSTQTCPLFSFWPTGCENGTYNKWIKSNTNTDKSLYARQIANAAVLELIKLDNQEGVNLAKKYIISDTKIEEVKDSYAELKAAQKAGKVIQRRNKRGEYPQKWTDCTDCSTFGVDCYEHRIKPEPHYRPWKPEEVPVGELYRNKNISLYNRYVITGIYADENAFLTGGGSYATNNSINLIEALRDGEVSLDHGKTWLPCGVLIDE